MVNQLWLPEGGERLAMRSWPLTDTTRVQNGQAGGQKLSCLSCLHANLLFCSAQQHCPPAPSSLPPPAPPTRRCRCAWRPRRRHSLRSPFLPSSPPRPSEPLLCPRTSPSPPPTHHRTAPLPRPLPQQDYFDIVKNPMDLSTIKRKLDTGQYQEPWQYVEDIWLMFNNAWLYNRKTSRVYKYCSKLAEVFETEIDPVMQSLGYCCGRKVSGERILMSRS